MSSRLIQRLIVYSSLLLIAALVFWEWRQDRLLGSRAASEEEKTTTHLGEDITPLKPFTRQSSRFSKELTFTPLVNLPTPGLIGEPGYAATRGFDSLANPMSRFFSLFMDWPYNTRKWRQPVQQVRFKSGLRFTEIFPSLEKHLTDEGYVLHSLYVGSTVVKKLSEVKSFPAGASCSAYFTNPNWTARYEDPAWTFQAGAIDIELSQNTTFPDDPENPLGTFVFTDVLIISRDYRFAVPVE